MIDIILQPREPVLVRDGRPFGVELGGYARTLGWPFPQTVAGAMRAWLGDSLGWDWSGDGPDRALRVAVHGPLLAIRRGSTWQALFPRPLDALAPELKEGEPIVPLRLRPRAAGSGGCLWPDGAELLPLAPPEGAAIDAKVPLGPYWSAEKLAAWLSAEDVTLTREEVRDPLAREGRVHVAVDPTTGTATEGALYSTEGLAFSADQAILCRLCPDGEPLEGMPDTGVVTLGGERRISLVRTGTGLWPTCPEGLAARAAGARRLTLTLATPAIFSGGWKPGWLDTDLTGAPPGLPGVRLKLVSAAVGRFSAVSGWRYDGRKKRRGPKPVRRVAPAGSVYFFRVEDGELTEDTIRRLWLAPLSDEPSDRKDGYGLAQPGVWTDSEGGNT